MIKVFKLLKKYNIPIAPYKITHSLKEAKVFAKSNYPVVLKAIAPNIIHKTDVGAVILDVWNEKMLESTYKHLTRKFKTKDIMLQKQIKKGIEIYAAIKHDNQFGNMALLGIGGIYVEVFKDISVRLCPLTSKMTMKMIDELKAKKIFLGYRGKAINIRKLASILKKLCIMAKNEHIKELEINPLKACNNDFYVIDARMVI